MFFWGIMNLSQSNIDTKSIQLFFSATDQFFNQTRFVFASVKYMKSKTILARHNLSKQHFNLFHRILNSCKFFFYLMIIFTVKLKIIYSITKKFWFILNLFHSLCINMIYFSIKCFTSNNIFYLHL